MSTLETGRMGDDWRGASPETRVFSSVDIVRDVCGTEKDDLFAKRREVGLW